MKNKSARFCIIRTSVKKRIIAIEPLNLRTRPTLATIMILNTNNQKYNVIFFVSVILSGIASSFVQSLKIYIKIAWIVLPIEPSTTWEVGEAQVDFL